jgi:ABC-type transport system involved in multi-copper enzyme maturation permease subunit
VALWGYGGKTFDYLPLLAWFLVLVVSGAGFISMGLFFSSLTRNQLMAAVMSFVGMLLFVAFFLIKEYLLSRGTVWREVLGRVSFVDVWLNSLEGKLGITDLIYHLSVTVFWLFLTVKVLESRKWR